MLQEAAITATPDVLPAASPKSQKAPSQLERWVGLQATTASRHAAALRPFTRDEFGTHPWSPSDGHLEAVNGLTADLRRQAAKLAQQVAQASAEAQQNPNPRSLGRLLAAKGAMTAAVRRTEDLWNFYLELFGQRQSPFGPMLLACDRIALDCYQWVYTGLGRAKPIPAPGPFCFMETGFGPLTYRRFVPIPKLGRRPNPFPLIQLPHHRLANPWTLGAVLHESAHNLQSDLGLWLAVPLAIARRLLRAGLPPTIAKVWARWHAETWADLVAVLLGGPEIVASLMDVTAQIPSRTQRFDARGVHPTPYLRILINLELLRRMGFQNRAAELRQAWTGLYNAPPPGWIPKAVLETFPQASALVVDTIVFQPSRQLGGKSLIQAFRFEARDQTMIEEAARRLAASRDPGIVPAIFLIGAARHAADRRWASPDVITRNFYRALVRR
ncbi:hypothetical protein [Microvirga arabica]|uniref:hypothetical protein n=1 Tax=Microvirga arabica TaxID=1128671 RepID=UPI0019397D30|nr:hypothetical protein [Microvirga arabica]MBM1174033.1 hypothetical protein [Microvirga arabica]